MESAEKISITVTPEMMRAVRASVEAGEYASTSEAVRDALRLWQRERDEQNERLAAIRTRVERAFTDRRPRLAASELRERLDALHAETLKAHRDEAL